MPRSSPSLPSNPGSLWTSTGVGMTPGITAGAARRGWERREVMGGGGLPRLWAPLKPHGDAPLPSSDNGTPEKGRWVAPAERSRRQRVLPALPPGGAEAPGLRGRS